MPGLLAVYEKELADHLGSRRFLILFAFICVAGLAVTYMANQTIRQLASDSSVAKFVFLRLFTGVSTSSSDSSSYLSFVFIVSFIGPLAGLALGFDSVNSERTSGTMSRVISQPIYRDSFINGKFLAGLTTVTLMIGAIMAIVCGLGLALIGVPPTGEEIGRIVVFFLITVVYVAFWMALAVLFSTLFRQGATSAIAAFAVWILMAFFMSMIAGIIANAIVPVSADATGASQLANLNVAQMIARISPTQLYQEAITPILVPETNFIGYVLQSQAYGMISSPLPLGQSILVVWPQITSLVSLMMICFAIAYAAFMREEIRS